MTSEEARRLALALPEAVEQDHHGRPSFRVAGKIFATLWDRRIDVGGVFNEAGASSRQINRIPRPARKSGGAGS